MSGVSLFIEGADELERLGLKLPADLDLGALLEQLGALVESQSRRRIIDEKRSPEGVAWADWSERYAGRQHGPTKAHAPHPGQLRAAGGHSLLRLHGDLLDSLQFAVTGTDLEVGSNLVYAATHQYGDDERKIPARPYLGLSDENQDELLAATQKFIAAVLP